MERQRGTSNLDTITIRNLSDTYPVLIIRDSPNTFVKSYASRYKCGTRRCDLFVTEKMTIALADPKVLLNKRTELISKCLDRNKFILSKVK